MKIYQAEIDAGLETQIKANASIAYTMPTMLDNDVASSNTFSTDIKDIVAKASAEDDDVFKVYSILVSTSWNKNDDVFSPEEVWASRETPMYKPTNLEHDEKVIVGNIIGNWPVDKNFELLEGGIENKDLPDVYHILVASVIYRQWQDPEYKARSEQLIREIQSGQKCVSMECIFKGFDYAVESPNGEYHVVARGENTAFLTQHLRAYGGGGVYQDHKVGRLLRNITFSGKGFVANPANPDSVIFNSDRDFPFSKASCIDGLCFNKKSVSNNVVENPISEPKQESEMSDYLEKEVADLKAALESSKAEVKELTVKLSEASVKEYEAQIEELKASLENVETEKESFVAVSNAAEEKVASLEATVAELTEKLNEAEAMMGEMKDKEKKVKRVASLVEAGFDEEDAVAQVEEFNNLTDDQFSVFAMSVKKYMKGGKVKAEEDSEAGMHGDDKKKEKKEDEAEAMGPKKYMKGGKVKAEEDAEAMHCDDKDKMKKKDDEAKAEELEAEVVEASEEVLDTAEASEEDITLTLASEDVEEEAVASLRSNLQDWVNQKVLKK